MVVMTSTPAAGSSTATVSDEPEQLLALAVRAARAAGAELMLRYGHIEGLETKSTATDPVSDADKAAERLLLELITTARPDDAMIGEEGTDRSGTSGLTWVVDPLDGTVNYLYQLANFSVSVACEDAQGGLVGVVFDPVADRLFSAVRGGGATRSDSAGTTTLRVSDPVPLDRALVATGFGYDAGRRALQGEFVAALLPHIRDIRRFGGAALDLCAVAAGAVDGYFEEGINHWDHAAGGLIVQEAGGLMTHFAPTGHERGWLAAGPSLHAEMMAFAAVRR
jgi:myo-inositol-1(or 4)-monophosphatase